MTEREEALTEAIDALELDEREYELCIAVTIRSYHRTTITAFDDEDAIRRAKLVNIHDNHVHDLTNDDTGGIEGDEVIMVEAIEDDGYDYREIATVDMRQHGEPFSWVAVDIVKDMAKLDALTPDPEVVEALIRRAVAACTKGD